MQPTMPCAQNVINRQQCGLVIYNYGVKKTYERKTHDCFIISFGENKRCVFYKRGKSSGDVER